MRFFFNYHFNIIFKYLHHKIERKPLFMNILYSVWTVQVCDEITLNEVVIPQVVMVYRANIESSTVTKQMLYIVHP